MPNTKSAARRVRNSAHKQLHNQIVKNRLKTLERNFLSAVAAGKKEDASSSYRLVSSAFDKAAKTGVVHSATAARKKSRLAVRLNGVK